MIYNHQILRVVTHRYDKNYIYFLRFKCLKSYLYTIYYIQDEIIKKRDKWLSSNTLLSYSPLFHVFKILFWIFYSKF